MGGGWGEGDEASMASRPQVAHSHLPPLEQMLQPKADLGSWPPSWCSRKDLSVLSAAASRAAWSSFASSARVPESRVQPRLRRGLWWPS